MELEWDSDNSCALAMELAQNCDNFGTLAVELLQFCTKPSKFPQN